MSDIQSAQAENYQTQSLQALIQDYAHEYHEGEKLLDINCGMTQDCKDSEEKRSDLWERITTTLAARDAEIARLQARQITPAMMDVYQNYLDDRDYAERHNRSLFSDEIQGIQANLWQAFIEVMESDK